MCMFVCMYIYIYIYICMCVYVCMFVCIYIFVCVLMFVCLYVHIYIYIYICVCVCVCVCVCSQEVDFMSFGTNDLTQMTCGFSRDDAGKFLKHYVDMEIYEQDPFQAVDQAGVGKLMQLCVSLARSVKPSMDIGICGEHGVS